MSEESEDKDGDDNSNDGDDGLSVSKSVTTIEKLLYLSNFVQNKDCEYTC